MGKAHVPSPCGRWRVRLMALTLTLAMVGLTLVAIGGDHELEIFTHFFALWGSDLERGIKRTSTINQVACTRYCLPRTMRIPTESWKDQSLMIYDTIAPLIGLLLVTPLHVQN